MREDPRPRDPRPETLTSGQHGRESACRLAASTGGRTAANKLNRSAGRQQPCQDSAIAELDGAVPRCRVSRSAGGMLDDPG
jgi:hypothetical protein